MPCANILFTPSYKKDGKSVYWHIRITNKITHNETPETLSHSAQSDPFFLYLLDRCRHFLSIRAGICHSTYDYPLCPATRFGRKVVCKHTWVPFDKISPSLPMAVIASEDNRFASHNGFDMIEIKKAMKENETRKKKRGASTISQQTAKNVFLWPQSSWIRKGFEVYFTFLIETCWSKERIMEVYLNSIEMGKGIYGAQATAKYKFKTTAAKLTRGQCALIAATLPNPIRFDSAHPSPYIKRRQGQILRLMNLVPKFPPVDKEKAKGQDTKKQKNKKKKK